MKLQPASRRELLHITAGVLIGSGVMILIFVLIKKFELSVIWGALLGAAAAIGNFYYLAVCVQRAAAADKIRAQVIMRRSYAVRLLVTVAAVVLGCTLDVFHWVAVVVPILLPRLTILVLQLTGRYKPAPPAPADEEIEETKEE